MEGKDSTIGNGSERRAGEAEAMVEGGSPSEGKDKDSAHGKEYDELKDRMLRLAAEFDNYKKRSNMDAERLREASRAEIVRSVLPVLDEFELALMAARDGNSGSDGNMIRGVEMIYTNLYDALKRAGLAPIPTDGRFNPELHEIVMTRESDREPGEILEVMKRGYMLGSIMLRPASVIVAGDRNGKNDDKKTNDTIGENYE